MGDALLKRVSPFNQRSLTGRLDARAGEAEPDACQTRILEEWRRSATPVEACLMNETVHGTLVAFDRFMIALRTREGLWGIYKHAILTIGPAPVASPSP